MTAAFDAWHARAMLLAVEYAEAVAESGDTFTARKALAAHLAELPMGEPVVMVRLGESLIDVPLYRHPKDEA